MRRDPWGGSEPDHALPAWLTEFLSSIQGEFQLQNFTDPLEIRSRIRGEYIMALLNHGDCYFCLKVHLINSSTFCTER